MLASPPIKKPEAINNSKTSDKYHLFQNLTFSMIISESDLLRKALTLTTEIEGINEKLHHLMTQARRQDGVKVASFIDNDNVPKKLAKDLTKKTPKKVSVKLAKKPKKVKTAKLSPVLEQPKEELKEPNLPEKPAVEVKTVEKAPLLEEAIVVKDKEEEIKSEEVVTASVLLKEELVTNNSFENKDTSSSVEELPKADSVTPEEAFQEASKTTDLFTKFLSH